MDDDLTRRLLFAEDNFLSALEGGTQMLTSYNQTWSTLPGILCKASSTGTINQETRSLAHSVASRIANFASCFIDVKRGVESFAASLQSDCDAIIQRMAPLDLNANPGSTHQDDRNHICPSTVSSNAESSSSPFLILAHQWLLDNIHNPYPTAKVKTKIAAASSSQVSSVNSWFINARRRIGWTTLCREHFSNCRADMINAAYRAFVEEDPKRPLSPEIRYSFVALRVAAEGLYPSTFTRSAFTGDLDLIGKDVAEESVTVGECNQVEQTNVEKTVEAPYPSPDPSIAASLVPDSITDESEEEYVAPPMLLGSKRPRSFVEPVNQQSSTTQRPVKRLRVSIPSATCLPSPPSSTNGIDVPSDDGSPEPFLQSETNDPQPSRKRRLSNADSAGTPKRPCHLASVLPTISDPLPRNLENEYSIDDWFRTNFDDLFTIPPPVDATEPDASAPWEVELFKDYDIPRNPKNASTSHPDTLLPVVTDLSDLDSLLQSVESDGFGTPSGVAGVSYTTSLDPSIPDISQADIDWMSLLNDPDTYQSTMESTISQYPNDPQPPPEIDLSMLQLPRVTPTVDLEADYASKQAKLHQFQAMQEAVRRMERELQSEGVIA